MRNWLVFVILGFMLFPVNVSAFNFEAGVDLKYSSPAGDFVKGFKPGLGYGLQFLYPINEKINTGVELSFLTLKTSDFDDLEFKETSFSVFGQYYFFTFRKFKLYFLANISYNQQSITMGTGEETGNVGGFGFGVKCLYPINSTWILNSVLSFDIVDRTNRINLIFNVNYKYFRE